MRRMTEVSVCMLLCLLGVSATVLAGESPVPIRQFLKLDIMLAQTGLNQPPTVPPSGTVSLSLRDSIALALQNNLAIQVEGFNPQLRDQALTGEKAVFDPSAFLELTRTDNRAPAASSYFLSGQALSDLWDYNVGLRQKLPTGGTYELRFMNEYANAPLVPTCCFSSRLGLTLTQPLLKNFGFEANETNIRIATNNQGISREELRLRVSAVVTNVKEAYFDLIFAQENLNVQNQSLRLARELVELNTARVHAGVAPPVEVTQAEAQEAAQVQNVILAEKAIQDAEDNLKVIVNLPLSGGWDQRIQPSEAPSLEVKPVNLEGAVQKALENRYEYKTAKLDIENKELSVRLSRNQLLPDLSLTGTVFANGARRLYGSDLSEMGSGQFVSYSVGVVLTVPLGNRAAQSSYLQSKLALDQAKTSLKNLELQIIQQVRQVVRQLEADAKRIDANRAARILAEYQLEMEQRRLQAGVSTTFNVLSFQRDLAAAQANEFHAITDYNKDLAELDNVLGTVLERNRIEM